MINNRIALGKVSIKILIFLFGNWKGGKKVNFLFVILLDEFFHYSLIGCFQFRNFRQFITVQWANWREIKLWAKTWMMGVVRRYWKPQKQKPKHIWLSLNNQRNNQEAPSTKTIPSLSLLRRQLFLSLNSSRIYPSTYSDTQFWKNNDEI